MAPTSSSAGAATGSRALGFIGAPSPYVFASAATGGETHFAAAGLSWRIGGRLFVRPGIGLAVHTALEPRRRRTACGPISARASCSSPSSASATSSSDRVAIEATWVHVSHAQLLSRQNPGMDIDRPAR